MIFQEYYNMVGESNQYEEGSGGYKNNGNWNWYDQEKIYDRQKGNALYD